MPKYNDISVKAKPGFARFTYTVRVSNKIITKWFSENSREGGEYKLRKGEFPEERLASIYLSCTKSDGLNFLEEVCSKTNIRLLDIKSIINKRYSDELKKVKNQVNRMNTIFKNKITQLENETI